MHDTIANGILGGMIDGSSEQWGRVFLDEHFIPVLDRLGNVAASEYHSFLGYWQLDRVQRTAKYDTQRFERLLEIIDGRLELVLSQYDRRVAFSVARSIRPVELHFFLSVLDRPAGFHANVLLGVTRAIALYGRRRKSLRLENHTAAMVTTEELFSLQRRLPSNLARVFGLVVLRLNAATGLRRTGKGQRLSTIPRSSRTDVRTPWRFEPDPALEAAIEDYDIRRARAWGVGGLDAVEGRLSTKFFWPVAVECSVPVTIDYRSRGVSHTTYSFMLSGRDVSNRATQLGDFKADFRQRFGLDLDDFIQLSKTLAKRIWHLTGFAALKQSKSKSGNLVFRSSLSEHDQRFPAAPSYLLSILSEAALRAPRQVWRETLAGGNQSVSLEAADTFIDAFTAGPHRDPAALAPVLFHDLEENSLVLDLLLMGQFFDLCFHAAVASRDGATGKVKGALFENQARTTLIDRLGLEASDLPLASNYKLRKAGIKDGEVDFCFIVGSTLVQVEIKSWSRSVAYHRGDYFAIQRRLQKLREVQQTVDNRGRILLDYLRQRHPHLDLCVNFICVADAEFVPADPTLHYGTVARVRTPGEIADLVQNEYEWTQVLTAARFSTRDI